MTTSRTMQRTIPRIYDAGPPTDAEARYFGSLMDDMELSYVQGASSGVRVTDRTAIRCVAVFACIRVIAETIAGLDLHYYERLPGGGHRRYPNWLDTLLSVAPNPTQTRFDWIEQTLRHFELWGRCYSEIVQGPGGVISALVPLHPSRMKTEALPNGRLRFLYTELNGEVTEYSQDEIWHMHFMSDDGVTGEVPVELGKETIGLCRALELHASRFFGNGARPGVVLETEASLDVDTVERLRESWERIHRGPQNSHKTAVLDGGVKARPFEQATNQDSQFTAVRQFETERVCSFFRVPPHMVQLLDRATFSNIEQQSIDFRNHCIAPRCTRMELSFMRDLVPDPANYFVKFDLNDLERGDSTARMGYYTAAIDRGILSINEARAREGLNPIEGGDIHFFPLNMTTVEAMARQSEAAPVQLPQLVQVLDALAKGLITAPAAGVLMQAAFPQLSDGQINAVIAGVVPGTVPAPPSPGVPGLPAPKPPEPEMTASAG